MEKKDKKEKIKKPIDKKKLVRNIVIILIVLAMLLSVAATLIFNIIYALQN